MKVSAMSRTAAIEAAARGAGRGWLVRTVGISHGSVLIMWQRPICALWMTILDRSWITS